MHIIYINMYTRERVIYIYIYMQIEKRRDEGDTWKTAGLLLCSHHGCNQQKSKQEAVVCVLGRREETV